MRPKVELEFDPRDVSSLFPFDLGRGEEAVEKRTLIADAGDVVIYMVGHDNRMVTDYGPFGLHQGGDRVLVYTVPMNHEITIEVRKHELPF